MLSSGPACRAHDRHLSALSQMPRQPAQRGRRCPLFPREDPFPPNNNQPLNFKTINYPPSLPGMFSLFQTQFNCSTYEVSFWTLTPQLYLGS